MTARAFVLVALLAGCTSGVEVSSRDGCAEVWTAVCDRYYQCYSPQQIAEIGLPPTAAGCATQLTESECVGFGGEVCGDGTAYHPTVLGTCTDAILVVDCMLVADAPGTVPACEPLCGP